ncbi:EAL domain-containing protein [Hyphomicrobiales bacterium BP6-180914]|uniref:EAL domain-containing protein n=1 Tax=Lichenifustis flavocetrariae TaxID=2949735 RepID=A0AA42CIC1_9HYPH|nr:EAL domain-containing protein [Lichenifustis flavocetrariae]
MTGIANRMVFARRVEAAIQNSQVDRRVFALFLIDLDNFKDVNDGFGHDVGDALLCHAAERIAAAVCGPDRVARLGGDEFATLIDDCTCPADLAAVATRIIAFLREPLRYRGHVVEASCSIGISIYPNHGSDAAELQRFADLALYRAKAAGRTTFVVFDEQLRREYDDRRAIGSDLKLAIEQGDVEPWFQPIVEARTSKLVAVEALARWRHPTRGLLQPAMFLSLAEERGLTNELFIAMLRGTCRKTLSWVGSGLIKQASVNVSPSQFRSGQLARIVDNIVRDEGFPPSALIVEITEDVLLNDLGNARLQLEEVAGLGVHVALDDFGVGYSNIGYLRRLPLHQLKLDRVLTADIAEDPKARTILAAIVEIARTLDLRVVAEGVETVTQAEWLSHLGCDRLQGFYFGRATEHDRLQASWQPDVVNSMPSPRLLQG